MKEFVIPIVIGTIRTVNKELVNELVNNKTSWDHPNYSIVEMSQNTEKSYGDLKTLVITQTPVKTSVNVVVKTLKE